VYVQQRQSYHACTLRAAIQEANASPGTDTINLLAGVYTLSLGPAGDEIASSGDLDITGTVTINGPSLGTGMAIIDGNASDRAIEIHSGSVTIDRIGIRNGGLSAGGILVRNSASLVLTKHASGTRGGMNTWTINRTARFRNNSFTGGGSHQGQPTCAMMTGTPAVFPAGRHSIDSFAIVSRNTSPAAQVHRAGLFWDASLQATI
jgi:hypothetical protein